MIRFFTLSVRLLSSNTKGTVIIIPFKLSPLKVERSEEINMTLSAIYPPILMCKLRKGCATPFLTEGYKMAAYTVCRLYISHQAALSTALETFGQSSDYVT